MMIWMLELDLRCFLLFTKLHTNPKLKAKAIEEVN